MAHADTTLTPWRAGLGMSGWDDESNYVGARIDGFYVYSKHRDSDLLNLSNYDYIVRRLRTIATEEGVPDCVEEPSFGHWAVGHVDQIVLTKDAPRAVIREAEDILDRLRDYPALDEDDWSEREETAAQELWDSESPRWKLEAAKRERDRYHWLAGKPVWPYGRLTWGQLCCREDEIAEALVEQYREMARG